MAVPYPLELLVPAAAAGAGRFPALPYQHEPAPQTVNEVSARATKLWAAVNSGGVVPSSSPVYIPSVPASPAPVAPLGSFLASPGPSPNVDLMQALSGSPETSFVDLLNSPGPCYAADAGEEHLRSLLLEAEVACANTRKVAGMSTTAPAARQNQSSVCSGSIQSMQLASVSAARESPPPLPPNPFGDLSQRVALLERLDTGAPRVIEVPRIVEVPKMEVVEKVKEVPKYIEVPRIQEVIKEVVVPVPREVIKEVTVEVPKVEVREVMVPQVGAEVASAELVTDLRMQLQQERSLVQELRRELEGNTHSRADHQEIERLRAALEEEKGLVRMRNARLEEEIDRVQDLQHELEIVKVERDTLRAESEAEKAETRRLQIELSSLKGQEAFEVARARRSIHDAVVNEVSSSSAASARRSLLQDPRAVTDVTVTQVPAGAAPVLQEPFTTTPLLVPPQAAPYAAAAQSWQYGTDSSARSTNEWYAASSGAESARRQSQLGYHPVVAGTPGSAASCIGALSAPSSYEAVPVHQPYSPLSYASSNEAFR